MTTPEAALRHLEAGGAVLMFPSGGIDPDPACMPGADAALDGAFGTVEIILRRAPATQLVLAIMAGVLLPEYASHPLTRLRRDRQRISEYARTNAPGRQRPAPGALCEWQVGRPVTRAWRPAKTRRCP